MDILNYGGNGGVFYITQSSNINIYNNIFRKQSLGNGMFGNGLGGLFFIAGFCMVAYNIRKTIALAPESKKESVQVSYSGWTEPTVDAHRKIEGLGLFGYTLVMKEYSLAKTPHLTESSN